MRTRSSDKKAQSASFDRSLDEQKQFVLPEVGEIVSLEDDAFSRSLYHHVAPESAIDDFLKKSRSYSLAQRRWKLPRSCTKLLNNDFYTPFLTVFSSILKHFWNEATVRGTRRVIDSHATNLPHCELDSCSTTHSSRPSFVIRAEGPSFQLPVSKTGEKPPAIGFSNATACIDIQIQHDQMPVSEQLMRVAIYARQIFIQQPNRRFVRLLVLSEEHFRLYHFDRSGVQYTPYTSFHDNPHTFVRLILGLSSPYESDIGLDSTIQWTIENGRKVDGTLTTRRSDGTEITYPLLKVMPFFFRGNIRGRATICWSVRDPVTGEDLVVKDSWKSEDRVSEHVYLQDAVGSPGVVQMISCEPDRDETRNLRGFSGAPPREFHNRVETRLVMKAYGKSVTRFTSAMQVLCALRDAIAGHMEMYNKGTLHRDVSIHNVLFGKAGAEPGLRGILIDFDVATRRGVETIRPEDWLIGTRLYQSIAVLSSSEYRDPLPRDHLDDLESFLYVLVHIMFAYDSQGVLQSFPSTLHAWHDESLGTAARLKQGFLSWKTPPIAVEEHWPIPCINLLLAYQAFLLPFVHMKADLNLRTRDARKDRVRLLAAEVVQHYTRVLQLFDEAIDQLNTPGSKWKLCYDSDSSSCVSVSSNDSETPSAARRDNPLKRVSEEYPVDQPPAKRPSDSPRITRNVAPVTRRSPRISPAARSPV
ncbi:hypothetical protein EST38_g11942 [Candolleomyces aberdarensis]|uniref:Fungal-type protein kinase domain-containing protein n=1 Tax=Candolleomyces aberdarensis TaxID=2316362 RepID=A0A4Q2D696_9AGAR|nr:hypothetical protein EST38_g11942 [Candolleomyces aberdarensis]